MIAWVLLLLHTREMHGYKVHRELLARGIDLDPTTTYRWLRRFERDRWVAARWSAPVSGPRRHVYVLTAEGRSMLHTITALIAATHDTYGTFLDTHADVVAGRGVDAADCTGVPTSARRPSSANQPSSASSSRAALRPHKELLIGWLLLEVDAGASYGWELRRMLQARSLKPDDGALYRMLRRFEGDKWVQSRWMQPAAGPRRRFYRLTARGRRNLDEIARLIELIRASHESYLQAYEHVDDLAKDATRDGSPEEQLSPPHAILNAAATRAQRSDAAAEPRELPINDRQTS